MASGLFARHGLDVELVAPVRRAPTGPVQPVPAGTAADFAVAGVHTVLASLHRGEPAGRFVAVVHQRSPLAAFVAVDSVLRSPRDLAGRRVAASTVPWFDHEYRAGLAALGLEPGPVVAPHADGTRPSLATGEVDVIGSWAESVAPLRRRAGMAVRPIAFGPDVYTVGIVADASVPPAVAARMVRALSAAYVDQRRRPGTGLDELCRRFPSVPPADVVEEWSLLDPYIFAGGRPLAMERGRWSATIAHAAATHGFAPPVVADVCREALLFGPAAALSA